MHKLYPGISTPEAETGPCRGRVESLQWQIALRALRLRRRGLGTPFTLHLSSERDE
jgi:hypothetical protein